MALYIVATPIGNLEDITLRALRILGEVDVVACEDTRVTKKLLDRYEIKTQTLSFHAHSGEAKVEKIIELLREGRSVALVTDAGTPGISDPGGRLVKEVREALPETEIVAVPGVSALTAALSVSGVETSEFMFLGFPPHKKGRETFFKRMAASDTPLVFYESPHRILKALESMREFAPQSRIVIARELTKVYESVKEGSADELLAYFSEHPDEVRGEFVVIAKRA
jgi:16S rRNA (cytidine1402-2'-O)-methyltransferase